MYEKTVGMPSRPDMGGTIKDTINSKVCGLRSLSNEIRQAIQQFAGRLPDEKEPIPTPSIDALSDINEALDEARSSLEEALQEFENMTMRIK